MHYAISWVPISGCWIRLGTCSPPWKNVTKHVNNNFNIFQYRTIAVAVKLKPILKHISGIGTIIYIYTDKVLISYTTGL